MDAFDALAVVGLGRHARGGAPSPDHLRAASHARPLGAARGHTSRRRSGDRLRSTRARRPDRARCAPGHHACVVACRSMHPSPSDDGGAAIDGGNQRRPTPPADGVASGRARRGPPRWTAVPHAPVTHSAPAGAGAGSAIAHDCFLPRWTTPADGARRDAGRRRDRPHGQRVRSTVASASQSRRRGSHGFGPLSGAGADARGRIERLRAPYAGRSGARASAASAPSPGTTRAGPPRRHGANRGARETHGGGRGARPRRGIMAIHPGAGSGQSHAGPAVTVRPPPLDVLGARWALGGARALAGGAEVVPARGPPSPLSRTSVSRGPCRALVGAAGGFLTDGSDGRLRRLGLNGSAERAAKFGAAVDAVAAAGDGWACIAGGRAHGGAACGPAAIGPRPRACAGDTGRHRATPGESGPRAAIEARPPGATAPGTASMRAARPVAARRSRGHGRVPSPGRGRTAAGAPARTRT